VLKLLFTGFVLRDFTLLKKLRTFSLLMFVQFIEQNVVGIECWPAKGTKTAENTCTITGNKSYHKT